MSEKTFIWIEIGLVACGLFITLVINTLLVKKISRSQSWISRISYIVRIPLLTLIWAVGILYITTKLSQYFEFSFLSVWVETLRKFCLIGFYGWLFFRSKKEFDETLKTFPGRKIDHQTLQLISRILTVFLGVVLGLIILHIFGLGIAPLLTFGGVGVAAVGLATKDILANTCSGIFIQLTRPFIIDDLIIIEEKKIEGQVEDIGWVRTSIRDKEKRLIDVPNIFFSNFAVVNSSKMICRRFKQIIKISSCNLDESFLAISHFQGVLLRSSEIDQGSSLTLLLKNRKKEGSEIEITGYSLILDPSEMNRFQCQLIEKYAEVLNQELPEIKIIEWELFP